MCGNMTSHIPLPFAHPLSLAQKDAALMTSPLTPQIGLIVPWMWLVEGCRHPEVKLTLKMAKN